MTNSIPQRLRSAQAAIEAATARYLQQGGTIAQVDSYGRPIEHLSWKDEAERAKAAGLSYISEHKAEKPAKQARKPLTMEQDKERQARQMKLAVQASAKAKQARRDALAPRVRAMASKCPVGQIARQLGISAGMVRRIGRDHDITLNKSRGAMPAKEIEA